MQVGDYIIYEPKVLHTWKALKALLVLTVQFKPETDSYSASAK
jgi:hypothetical protein